MLNFPPRNRAGERHTGRPAIAFKGGKPWHGYGALLGLDASLEEWQTAAGLDFEYQKHPIYVQTTKNELDPSQEELIVPTTAWNEIQDQTAVCRSDTLEPLSVVSKKFKLVQPAEVINFFSDLIKTQGWAMETAGALNKGRRVWALAKTRYQLTLHKEAASGLPKRVEKMIATGIATSTRKFLDSFTNAWNHKLNARGTGVDLIEI